MNRWISFACAAVLAVASASSASAHVNLLQVEPLHPAAQLQNGGPAPFGSIFGSLALASNPIGDTYSSAPLVQDGFSAYYISNTDTPGTHIFDGIVEPAGMNLAGAVGDTFVINESFSLGIGPNGGDVIRVQYTALNALGAPTRWVAAGVAGPNGPFTSWRMDVGTLAGGTNDIAITTPVLSSGFTAFNSAMTPLGTFAMSLDTSTATGVSGAAIVGLGGANIAGFDMASIQMFWEVAPIPEPSTAILAVIGVLGLGLRRNRR